jgi:hypothetical protein
LFKPNEAICGLLGLNKKLSRPCIASLGLNKKFSITCIASLGLNKKLSRS